MLGSPLPNRTRLSLTGFIGDAMIAYIASRGEQRELPLSTTDFSRHHFISITVVPVDVRIVDGEVEYAEAPERQADVTPEQVCTVCWKGLDLDAVLSECPGPKVPDDLSSLLGG